MYLHEVFEVKIQARELINEGKVVDGDGVGYLSRLVRDVSPDFRAMLLHIDDKVLELLLVHLEVLHHHIVTEAVALVKVLPIVQQVSRLLL